VGDTGFDVVQHAYVHVPFCPQVCPFCSFHVVRRRPGVVAAYLARLDVDAADVASRYDVALDTTYLGGGTPSSLRIDELASLLGSLRRRFGSLGDEVTLEVHPATASAQRFAAWRDLGVTRFSIGLESTDDAVLARLGRAHSAADGLRAAEWALDAVGGTSGSTVSVDLMCAIGGQDIDAELERIAARGVDHVSCYTLTIEEGTPFERDGVEVDPDVAADAFDAAGSTLGAAGIARYEVSNHAQVGHECRHNLGYWRSEWWLGLGPSAAALLPPRPSPARPRPHSRSVLRAAPDLGPLAEQNGGEIVGARAVNPRLDRWLVGDPPEVEVLDGPAFVADALVAGLRPVDGVDLVALSARTGVDVGARYGAAISELVDDGLATFDGMRLAATPAGMRVLDGVTARLLVPAPVSAGRAAAG
jgi:oxygen-independent coproporphyrinogen-3 oxidase